MAAQVRCSAPCERQRRRPGKSPSFGFGAVPANRLEPRRSRERARELGADVVIDHTAGPWDAGIEPVDLAFDTAGGERLLRSAGVLREGGRLVSVAEEPPQAPGVSSAYFVVEPNREQVAEIAGLLDGDWPPLAIDSVFTLEEAASAFERSMAADKRGKVVLEVAR